MSSRGGGVVGLPSPFRCILGEGFQARRLADVGPDPKSRAQVRVSNGASTELTWFAPSINPVGAAPRHRGSGAGRVGPGPGRAPGRRTRRPLDAMLGRLSAERPRAVGPLRKRRRAAGGESGRPEVVRHSTASQHAKTGLGTGLTLCGKREGRIPGGEAS